MCCTCEASVDSVRLIEPEPRYFPSYQEACGEYRARRVADYAFTDAPEEALFEKFRCYREGVNLKPGRVPATYFWLVSGKRFLGEVCIRHELNDALRRRGGHIGYGVRSSCWNRGHGTRMLALALEEARKMGLTRVLITCDDGNLASARVIEKNGGRLQDVIWNKADGKTVLTRRYWIGL